ncbi:hypothetical protein CR165_22260 [Pseudoroseomonas aestuarii]|uniref:Uncharacterized protein n=1 Tax=Teichococcus aestuarii TaxID=568898 RepID=A0A2U1UY90_9PROT|nr:hypothetical protein CR165_22260 [Pseudoroseomonas aestuarii]
MTVLMGCGVAGALLRKALLAGRRRPGQAWADGPDALEQALHDWRPLQGTNLVHHSGCGVQYVEIRYSERLAQVGIGTVGRQHRRQRRPCAVESVIGLFKTGVIRRRGPWRGLEGIYFNDYPAGMVFSGGTQASAKVMRLLVYVLKGGWTTRASRR